MLGFNVSYNGPGPSTVAGYYAIAGCTDPSNGVDPGCGAAVLGRSEKSGQRFLKVWGAGSPFSFSFNLAFLAGLVWLVWLNASVSRHRNHPAEAGTVDRPRKI